MNKYSWSNLTSLQVGKYAEYYVKMEFTQHGFDVYTAEVDDKGIDFVMRRESPSGTLDYYDVQVKSLRGSNYVFFPKTTFSLRKNLLAAIVTFEDGHEPELFLIPSLSWRNVDALLVSHDYEGKKSAPEWGINVSKKNRSLLERFLFHETVKKL